MTMLNQVNLVNNTIPKYSSRLISLPMSPDRWRAVTENPTKGMSTKLQPYIHKAGHQNDVRTNNVPVDGVHHRD